MVWEYNRHTHTTIYILIIHADINTQPPQPHTNTQTHIQTHTQTQEQKQKHTHLLTHNSPIRSFQGCAVYRQKKKTIPDTSQGCAVDTQKMTNIPDTSQQSILSNIQHIQHARMPHHRTHAAVGGRHSPPQGYQKPFLDEL